jgi:type 2 lantibiotic biosynthesis protein LanM
VAATSSDEGERRARAAAESGVLGQSRRGRALSVERLLQQEGLRWDERLAGAGPRHGVTASAARVPELIGAWRDAVDPAGAGTFARRLAWDGLDEEAAGRLLTGEGPGRPALPPEWPEELAGLREACRRAAGDPGLSDADWLVEVERRVRAGSGRAPEDLVPFAHLLWPIAVAGLERLEREVSPAVAAMLSAGVKADLVDALLDRLSEVVTRCLFEEFTAGRRFGRSVLLALSPPAGEDAPRGLYAAFCRRNLRDGLEAVLASYPVLGRLLADVCLQWRESSEELLSRLEHDRPQLREVLGVDTGARLVRVRPSAGDRHRRGRSVAVLRFDDGSLIVYKPRDMTTEARFADLVAILAERLGVAWKAAPAVVAPDSGHGYSAHVRSVPCASPDELTAFYRSAGRLLAVLYLLGATDFHADNLIASGTDLVVVDAETLFEDRVEKDDDPEGGADDRVTTEPLALSIMHSLMLPAWLPDAYGAVFRDVSALGADAAPLAPVSSPGWRNANTDLMVWSTRQTTPPHPASLPVGRGGVNPVGDHVEAVALGFREVCSLAYEPDARRALAAGIRAFEGARRRVLLRHTRTYAIVREHALAPAALRSAVVRGCELERLSRAFVLRPERPGLWPLLRAEIHDLEDLDVPYFDHVLGSTSLSGSCGDVPDVIAGDAVERSLERLASMSPESVAWQVRLIRTALGTRGSRAATDHGDRRGAESAERCVGRLPGVLRDEPPVLDPEAAAREAGRLAGVIATSALVDGRGDVTWLTPAMLPSLLPEARRVALGLIPDGLYDGRTGVFAFLCAWSGYGGGEEAAAQAQAALAPVLRRLDVEGYERHRFLRRLGLGLNGVGGFLRVAGHLASAAADGLAWQARRDRLARAVDEALVASSGEVDLLGGVAGCAAPLAALHAVDPGEATAAALAVVGRRLLDAQDARTGGWFTESSSRPLTGLSHGASGIGLALLEAGIALGEERYVYGAARAFAYEDRVFDEATLNWPDFRGDPDEPRFANGWCHGAPGIALARMRALQLAPAHPDAGLWRRAVEAGAATTVAAPLGVTDHLCCGNLGRAAVLWALGEGCGRPDWTQAGDALTAAVVDRASRAGGYRLPQFSAGGDGLVFPGLMNGHAGLAAHLLAAATGDRLTHLLV